MSFNKDTLTNYLINSIKDIDSLSEYNINLHNMTNIVDTMQDTANKIKEIIKNRNDYDDIAYKKAIDKIKSDRYLQKQMEGILKLSTLNKNLFDFANNVYWKSLEYVPVDTGALKKSAYITGYINSEGGPAYKIGYSKYYAKFVHEISFYSHKYPTRYKYLEDALLDVYNVTPIDVPITITYNPLCLYLNDKTKGESLFKINQKSLDNEKDEYRKLQADDLHSWLQSDRDSLNDEQKQYLDIFSDYTTYWFNNGKTFEDIEDTWFDRTRHEFPDNWLSRDDSLG